MFVKCTCYEAEKQNWGEGILAKHSDKLGRKEIWTKRSKNCVLTFEVCFIIIIFFFF